LEFLAIVKKMTKKTLRNTFCRTLWKDIQRTQIVVSVISNFTVLPYLAMVKKFVIVCWKQMMIRVITKIY